MEIHELMEILSRGGAGEAMSSTRFAVIAGGS
jgi:hypothetical protein